MKQTLISIGIFSLGIGIGVLATRSYFDKKYKQLADEEIESCKAIFSKKKEDTKVIANGGAYDGSVELYSKGIESEEVPYSTYHTSSKPSVEKAETLSPKEEDEPFEITVEDFEEVDGYNKITLNYYMEDGMLIYEEGEDIADESLVGSNNLDDFVAVPDRSSYFRDNKNKIDYEVIKVDGSYQELIAGGV